MSVYERAMSVCGGDHGALRLQLNPERGFTMSNDIKYLGKSFRDDDAGVTYTPYVDSDGAVGYRCERMDSTNSICSTEYIYLNASGGSDDGVPTVFVYIDGDRSFTAAAHYYALFEAE